MKSNGKVMPQYNFGIVTNSQIEARAVGEIAKTFYDSYCRNLCNFNAQSNRIYCVLQRPSGKRQWNNYTNGYQPSDIRLILTYQKFVEEYLTEIKSEVINNYQIF